MPETNNPGQSTEQQATGSAAEAVQPDAAEPVQPESVQPESVEPEPTPPASAATDAGSTQGASSRAVFRVSPVASLFVLFLLVCMTPVAAGPYQILLVLYLVPILLLGWIVRTKTVADQDGLTARTLFRSRHIGWDELRGIKLLGRTRTLAVLADDSEVRLPEVRVRHLAQLAQLSGGRLPDPTAPAAPTSTPAEPATTAATVKPATVEPATANSPTADAATADAPTSEATAEPESTP